MGWRIADRLELLFLDDEGQPDPLFDECEVVARAVSIDDYTAVMDLIGEGIIAVSGDRDRIAAVAGKITASIVEWNLEDPDGEPTPVTADGLMSHPKHVTFAVVNAWMDAQRAGPRPFAKPSNGGAPPAEIPMQSLAS